MDALEQAKTLGQALANSNEFQTLISCEKDFYRNKEAVELLEQYDKETMKMKNLRGLGMSVPSSSMEALEGLQAKIQSNPAIQQLLSTQKAYEDLLKRVNEEINKEIDSLTRAHMGDADSGPRIIEAV